MTYALTTPTYYCYPMTGEEGEWTLHLLSHSDAPAPDVQLFPEATLWIKAD